MFSGASQNASHLMRSITSGVMSTLRSCSGLICWSVARRKPETTVNSGVALLATLAHVPPLRRTDRSLIVGVPLLTVSCIRTSWFASPSQVSESASPATAAESPGAAL